MTLSEGAARPPHLDSSWRTGDQAQGFPQPRLEWGSDAEVSPHGLGGALGSGRPVAQIHQRGEQCRIRRTVERGLRRSRTAGETTGGDPVLELEDQLREALRLIAGAP